MKKSIIDKNVRQRIDELEHYLRYELKLSKDAARYRTNRMREYTSTLGIGATHALCRFRRWRELGWRCAIFEKDWIFAYEVFEGGIIIRDMRHTAGLRD